MEALLLENHKQGNFCKNQNQINKNNDINFNNNLYIITKDTNTSKDFRNSL
jgi:hypothetical protein